MSLLDDKSLGDVEYWAGQESNFYTTSFGEDT